MPLEAYIQSEARRLGFAAVGFAPAGPSQSFGRFRDWLGRGFAGGMDYMANHEALRADPRQLLPEARSVIVAAARYPSDPEISAFSNYARGRDYHAVIRDKLEALARGLAERLDRPLHYRACVDSAPVLEREWAVRAGLGWIGRQGQLIHPTAGACLLLGELLVNVALPPAAPLPNRCGDCRRCVDVCPTRAIGEDRRVDARRCISYLTIEHDGEIPAELRPATRGALFGCDRCTAVCPWNQSGSGSVMPELRPQPMPDAPGFLALDEPAFRRQFSGSAALRSGLARLQRNARLAVS